MPILGLFLIDFYLMFGPKWGHFGARFSKKIGSKFDMKIDDFLDGFEEHGVGGLRPRQGSFFTT